MAGPTIAAPARPRAHRRRRPRRPRAGHRPGSGARSASAICPAKNPPTPAKVAWHSDSWPAMPVMRVTDRKMIENTMPRANGNTQLSGSQVKRRHHEAGQQEAPAPLHGDVQPPVADLDRRRRGRGIDRRHRVGALLQVPDPGIEQQHAHQNDEGQRRGHVLLEHAARRQQPDEEVLHDAEHDGPHQGQGEAAEAGQRRGRQAGHQQGGEARGSVVGSSGLALREHEDPGQPGQGARQSPGAGGHRRPSSPLRAGPGAGSPPPPASAARCRSNGRAATSAGHDDEGDDGGGDDGAVQRRLVQVGVDDPGTEPEIADLAYGWRPEEDGDRSAGWR